jgi:hypothetical protein
MARLPMARLPMARLPMAWVLVAWVRACHGSRLGTGGPVRRNGLPRTFTSRPPPTPIDVCTTPDQLSMHELTVADLDSSSIQHASDIPTRTA